ncbi:hypothetical protein CRG98_034573 [Punica granatum]|uniref:Uncharacterized protein n=1 Tax=Punica granatum TaxID=22663 RepID=A0A2I0IM06_PUNGR|nr:hypothetical protein CRG98_034573 [Punica granatum]
MNSVQSFSRESLCGKPVGQNGVLTPRTDAITRWRQRSTSRAPITWPNTRHASSAYKRQSTSSQAKPPSHGSNPKPPLQLLATARSHGRRLNPPPFPPPHNSNIPYTSSHQLPSFHQFPSTPINLPLTKPHPNPLDIFGSPHLTLISTLNLP